MYKQLIGTWTSDPLDIESQEAFGNSTLEFREDGQLVYTIHGEAKDQIILLTYRVENNILVTNQPSFPREEKTAISFGDEGELILVYADQTTVYRKVSAL